MGDTFTAIPAAPGWSIAVFVEADADIPAEFSYHPIVAWDIQRIDQPEHRRHKLARRAIPIAFGMTLEQMGNRWAVRDPEGHFHINEDQSFDTEDEALKYFVDGSVPGIG